jgi:hypothetical protein
VADKRAFYGQELDCPDDCLTLWHTCPDCGQALVYCSCRNAQDYIDQLYELYRQDENNGNGNRRGQR